VYECTHWRFMSTNQVASWRQIFILPCDSFEDVTEWPDEAWIVNEFQTPQISLDLVAGKVSPSLPPY
jgi:hypothetical protein